MELRTRPNIWQRVAEGTLRFRLLLLLLVIGVAAASPFLPWTLPVSIAPSSLLTLGVSAAPLPWALFFLVLVALRYFLGGLPSAVSLVLALGLVVLASLLGLAHPLWLLAALAGLGLAGLFLRIAYTIALLPWTFLVLPLVLYALSAPSWGAILVAALVCADSWSLVHSVARNLRRGQTKAGALANASASLMRQGLTGFFIVSLLPVAHLLYQWPGSQLSWWLGPAGLGVAWILWPALWSFFPLQRCQAHSRKL